MSVEQSVPEFLPVLSAGSHGDPVNGACFMEYVSLLAGEKFSDKPRCVDLALTLVMQGINDSAMDDEDRALLAPLLPRTIGLGPVPRLRLNDPHGMLKPGSWRHTVEADEDRYERDCERLRKLAWPLFARRAVVNGLEARSLAKSLAYSDDVAAASLASWFEDLLNKATEDLDESVSAMQVSVLWAEWLHEAYESAMQTLGWPVLREAVCTVPEAAARVGVGAHGGV